MDTQYRTWFGARRYNPEGHGFDSREGHRIFQLT
jgi:hypothetical protein